MTRSPQHESEELMAEPVILINAFEVPAADADAFVAAWQKACNYLRSQPGYNQYSQKPAQPTAKTSSTALIGTQTATVPG
jgi:hypothetical protein